MASVLEQVEDSSIFRVIRNDNWSSEDGKEFSPFDNDQWNLSIEPFRSALTKELCETIWDFSAFGDSPVKEEIKRALLHGRTISAEATALSWGVEIKNIGRFAQEKFQNSGLLEFSEREVIATYETYRVENGKSVIKKRKGRADEVPFPITFLRRLYIDSMLSHRTIDLFKLDSWPTGRMPYAFAPHIGAPNNKDTGISFRGIPQEQIACECKLYASHGLRTLKRTTVCDCIYSLTQFFKFIGSYYPEVRSTEELTRGMTEHFIRWVNEGNISLCAGNRALAHLKGFTVKLKLLGGSVPSAAIVYESDGFKKSKKTPEFFSRNEQRKLLENLNGLSQPYRWMFTVHYQVGMRVSELCALTEGCLKKTISGTWYLEYTQFKTDKTNAVPVTDSVANAIIEAQKQSKNHYGEKCHYVFAKKIDEPITTKQYAKALKKYVTDYEILADDGTLLNVRTHKFRATVATNLINNPGIDDPMLIRMLLGQSDLGQMERYAKIHSTTMLNHMAPIIQRDELYIQNLGTNKNAAAIGSEYESPLCNGTCARPPESGACTNYNACYECGMFKPSRDSLELFKFQLSEVEKRITLAKANGFQRMAEQHNNLKGQLEDIIEKIENASVESKESVS